MREYDIFERLPDHGILWRDAVQGLQNAQAKLKELAEHSPYEFFAMHALTGEIVARVNASE